MIFLTLVRLLFTCVAQTAASNKALEERVLCFEKQGWEAIKKKDWNALSSVMTEDFLEVGEMGISGQSEALQDLRANLIITVHAMEKVKLLGLSNDLPKKMVKRVVPSN